MIFRIRLPRLDDILDRLESDDQADTTVRKPDDPVRPCACYGCNRWYNYTMVWQMHSELSGP